MGLKTKQNTQLIIEALLIIGNNYKQPKCSQNLKVIMLSEKRSLHDILEMTKL